MAGLASPNGAETALTKKERWVWGGCGGLAPVIIALATTPDLIFAGIHYWLGQLGRAGVLFTIGGLVTYLILHKDEASKWKAFVTGIGAPALLSSLVAGRPANAAPFVER